MPDTPTTAVTPEWRKVDEEVYMMLLQQNDALREHMMVMVGENEAQATELVALRARVEEMALQVFGEDDD